MAARPAAAPTLLLLLFLLITSHVTLAGNFSASCNGVSISGTTLNANCFNRNQQGVPASLDLNGHITNRDGTLQPGNNGNFGASCRSIGLQGSSVLTAQCRTTSGSYTSNYFDLNQYVSNQDGRLVWG